MPGSVGAMIYGFFLFFHSFSRTIVMIAENVDLLAGMLRRQFAVSRTNFVSPAAFRMFAWIDRRLKISADGRQG
jgi:hypothetical protein